MHVGNIDVSIFFSVTFTLRNGLVIERAREIRYRNEFLVLLKLHMNINNITMRSRDIVIKIIINSNR